MSQREPLVLEGSFLEGKGHVKIMGGHLRKPYRMSVVRSSVSVALEYATKYLGKGRGNGNLISVEEMKDFGNGSEINYWTKEKGMRLLVWRSSEGCFFVLVMPPSEHPFEVDHFFESIVEVAMEVNGPCTGVLEGVVAYDVKKIFPDALEVIADLNRGELHVGWVGVGKTLKDAVRGVSSIIFK